MSTKKTFESFVNSMNENVDLYKVYKKVSGKYSLRKPSYWGDLFNQRASIPYRELTKYDKELHSLDVYTTKELGCHNEYPLQSNFKVQVPQVFVLYCNTESGELGEYYGMSILVNTEGATYPRYACGMPDFEPELHNFANGIPESYLNIVTTGAQLLHEQMIVEGQFSWLTSDTNTQIGSERQNMITVFMYDNMGNKWTEKDYEGYGSFGGMDYYDLVATMNGYTEEDVKTMKGSFKELRQLGIDLAFGKIKTKDKKKKTLFPALVEDPRFNWKRHDFTQEAESDPNQSWYQEEESDDDYDDDYENGWYESKVNEAVNSKAYVKAGKLGYNDQFLAGRSLSWTLSVDLGLKATDQFVGPWLGFDHVSLYAIGKKGGTILDDALTGKYTYDELKAAASDFLGIKESMNEARSINKISKEFGETVNKMKDIVKIYIAAEDGSDEKATTRQQLIDLTKKKKALTNELDDAVAGKNKDVKLVITEGVMSDIHQMIGNHKSFDTFQKEFFKEYGHKKVMKKTPEFLQWLKALYNDFEYTSGEAIKEKYTKKSLLKKLGDADDAMIQTGNGKEYIIYNPDSNNDDNAEMWHAKSVFAVDQDGEEHEIAYKDIGLVMVESKVTEAQKQLTIKDVEKAWDSVYGEDFEYEYAGVYSEIKRKYKGKITKAELHVLWYNTYGEDLQDEHSGFLDKLEENLNEATVVMDAMDPKSKILKKLLKKHKVTMKVLDPSGPSGWPEVELTGSREDLQSVLADPNGWDDPELGEYIEESVVNEALSKEQKMVETFLNKIAKEFDYSIQDAVRFVKETISKMGLDESVVNEGNGQTVKEFGDLLALLLDEDSGMDIERAILAMDPKKARVLEKQISTLYKRLFDLTNDGFNLREDNSIVNEAVSRDTKIYQIATPAPQSMIKEELEELFGDDYRNIVTEFKEDEGYESVLMFNLSKSDIKKIEDNIADVLIWEYSIKKGKTITESVVTEAKNDGNLDTIADYVKQVLDDGKSFMDIGKKLKGAYKYDFSTGMMPMYIIPVSGNKIVIINKKYVENGQADRIVGDIAIGLMESKIQIKRRYTDNHPAQTSGRIAKVRNAMIEALADGILTEEEFNNILKEKSIDNKRWMRRNSKYFTVSENGIGLSKFGKRILTGIKPVVPVVSLTIESFISEKANISGAYNDLEDLLGTDMETMDDFQRIENDGTWEEMSDFIEMAGDVEVLRRYKFKSQKDIDKLAKYIMGESVVNEANYIKFKGKKVDISSLEMEDVDMKDYPDFSDAYFSYGEYSNGKEMTDEELSDFTDDNGDLANELAHDSLH